VNIPESVSVLLIDERSEKEKAKIDVNILAESAKALVRRLGNELSNSGVWAYRFDEHDLVGVEIHTVGSMQLLAPFDERTLDLFGFRIGLAHDVEHVGQHRI